MQHTSLSFLQVPEANPLGHPVVEQYFPPVLHVNGGGEVGTGVFVGTGLQQCLYEGSLHVPLASSPLGQVSPQGIHPPGQPAAFC